VCVCARAKIGSPSSDRQAPGKSATRVVNGEGLASIGLTLSVQKCVPATPSGGDPRTDRRSQPPRSSDDV